MGRDRLQILALGRRWWALTGRRSFHTRQEADLRRTVEESSRIQRGYGHYFDLSLVNSNLERTFRELQAALEKLRTEPQWVPVSWVY